MLAHVALLAMSAATHSPSVDEVGHMAGGLSYWQLGRFDVYRVNPSLVRVVATALVAMCNPKTDWTRIEFGESGKNTEFMLGKSFIERNGVSAFRYFAIARCACIPFSVLGAWVCFLWARELFGRAAGLTASVMWCFSPNVLANAQLITPDAAAAALGVAAGYLYWRWLKWPTWWHAALSGIGLGLAELSKFTWIILFGLWPTLWIVSTFVGRTGMRLRIGGVTRRGGQSKAGQESLRRWTHIATIEGASASAIRVRTRQMLQLLTILLLGLYVINAGYLFQRSFTKLGDYPFRSRLLVGLTGAAVRSAEQQSLSPRAWLGSIYVPLPWDYLLGIDDQRCDFETKFPIYLRGEWRKGGWWYYYLYALAVKMPLGTWGLVFLALGVTAFGRGYSPGWRDELAIAAPALSVLVLVSSQTGVSYLRYALPIFPFAVVWTSRIARAAELAHVQIAVVAAAALAWSVASSLWVYPHSLAYFNELAGGPRNGHSHLIDSNIDWGQDLLYLKRWLDNNPRARPLGLAYFGFFDPCAAGINYSLPPVAFDCGKTADRPIGLSLGPLPGWYAISVNYLRGIQFAAPDGRGGLVPVDGPYYEYFLRFRPVAMAGFSIYIYHITPDDANRVRRELGLPELPSTTNRG
jgi:hypothetical protein